MNLWLNPGLVNHPIPLQLSHPPRSEWTTNQDPKSQEFTVWVAPMTSLPHEMITPPLTGVSPLLVQKEAGHVPMFGINSLQKPRPKATSRFYLPSSHF